MARKAVAKRSRADKSGPSQSSKRSQLSQPSEPSQPSQPPQPSYTLPCNFNSFNKRKLIYGKPIDFYEPFVFTKLIEPFVHQWWQHFATLTRPIYPRLVKWFYATLRPDAERHKVVATVKGIKIELDIPLLREILQIPPGNASPQHTSSWTTSIDPHIQVQTVRNDPSFTELVRPTTSEIPVATRFMHHFITHNVLPRAGHRDNISFPDMFVLTVLLRKEPLNLAHMIIHQMIDASKHGSSNLPFCIILTCVFEHFKVNLDEEEVVKLTPPHGFYTKDSPRSIGFVYCKKDGWVRKKASGAEGSEHRGDEEGGGGEGEQVAGAEQQAARHEGRHEEGSTPSLSELQLSVQNLSTRMDETFQNLYNRMDLGFQNLNARIDSLHHDQEELFKLVNETLP